ncbi:hypothetical protein [Escherichia coli]|uniref:hypothetical protein n=1 Tax=Escherichia coli TaxID=562 RepID=UPI00105BBA15|nr:hypothetical protein [Escherichia coli]VEW03658.1 conserved hypothetical protein [Escherichia coli]
MSTNLPAMPAYMANMMPTLPQEMRDQLAQMFAPALESFGSAFNRVSLKGNRFRLITGGSETATFSDAFTFVIVAISPEQHCVWYANAYNGEEGVEPDAVWAQNEEPPANVPMSARVKDASGRNQYSMRRRFIVAPCLMNPQGKQYIDLDNLYVWDAGGMTTFGDDVALTGGAYNKAHSFTSYMNMCKSVGLFPCAIMTTAIFDMRQSVPAARFLPVCNQQGSPIILDMDTLSRVMQKAVEPATQQMLDWRRGRDDSQVPPQQPQQQQQQQNVVSQPQATVQQPQTVTTPQQQVVQPQVMQQQAPVQENVAQVYQGAQSVPQQQQGVLDDFLAEFTSAPALDSGVVTQQPVQEQPQKAGHVDTVASEKDLAKVVSDMTNAVEAAAGNAQQVVEDMSRQAVAEDLQQLDTSIKQAQAAEQPAQTTATADDLVARMNDIMSKF